MVPFIEGTRTLEIGHGPGHLNRFLLDQGLVAVAMDESATMGRLAKRKLSMSLRGAAGRVAARIETTSPKQSSQNLGSASSSLRLRASHSAQRENLIAMTGNLVRGLAQELPLRSESFDTVIATFPAEYINDAETLSEVKRCLSDGGRFVVLPAAMPKNGTLSWLFKVTGQASSEAMEVIQKRLKEPFVDSGFDVEIHLIEKKSGTLIVIVAKKISRRAE